MGPFHKLVLSSFGWTALGVSHNQWFHPFLIPHSFQSGVTWDEAFKLTVNWVTEYSNDHPTTTISPGVHHVIQLIQHADGGLFPTALTNHDCSFIAEVGLKILLEDGSRKITLQHRRNTISVWPEVVSQLQPPPNVEIEYADVTAATHGIIAQGVNCQGAMGSGVALAIMRKYPKVYESYKDKFTEFRPSIGYVDFITVAGDFVNDSVDTIIVANCYTQEYFGGDGKRYADLDAVRTCLTTVLDRCALYDLPLYLPRIASDLGGLSWTYEVYPVIIELAKQYPTVHIHVCILPRDSCKI